MNIWMWIGVVVGGLVVSWVVLIAMLSALSRRWARRDERELADDTSRLQRLLEQGDMPSLLRALNSQSDKVSGEAARIVAGSTDPSVTEALVLNYFYPWRADKEPYSEALAMQLAEDVVNRVMERHGFGQDAAAIDLLRRFDVPAAREAVRAFDAARALADAERASAETEAEKRRSIIEQLLANDAGRIPLRFPLPIETGSEVGVGKLISGMFDGGISAVGPNKFYLDNLNLPQECAFCGYMEGKKERYASSYFQLASAGWNLVGVNPQGEVWIRYKVCADCSVHDEKAKAILLSVDQDEQGTLTLVIDVLNPEMARRIQEMNPPEEMWLR